MLENLYRRWLRGRGRRAVAPPAPLKTVGLFATYHHLGDTLMCLPAAAYLKRAWPEVEIVWLSNKPTPLATRLAHLSKPYIARVLEGIDMEARTPLGEKGETGETFDAVVDLDMNNGGEVPPEIIKARVAADVFISPTRHFVCSDVPRPRHIHWVRYPFVLRHLELVDVLVGGGRPPPRFPVQRYDVSAWRALAAEALPAGARYIGFGTSGTDVRKMWPAARFAETIAHYVQAGFTPVLFPNQEDLTQHRLEEIRKMFPTAIFPELHLPEARRASEGVPFAIALAERLQAVLANDTGTAHILAASNAPMVIMYSDGITELFTPHIDFLKKLVAARNPHPPRFRQMERISVARVRRALDAALQEGAKRQKARGA